ncbi:methyltransferase, FxLD system [Salinispora arenicola]|uniref:methyltransferase, FxLD system n=1 Tax=Salinispora arenicola TaxID=168697 RepID=UPI00036D54C3|nr:methyltransferase, FxLD system [Salinispora arenicola]
MPTPTWHQATIATDPQTGGQVLATELAPELDRATNMGTVTGWWYIRKTVWRVRICTDDAGYTAIGDRLDKLTADGRLLGWHRGIYEPETVAFGGPAGMDCAHQLFHADSHHLLARIRAGHAVARLGRRETTVLLCAVLLRSAGLDRYEQADVWAKVAAERPVDLADPAVFDGQRREVLVKAMSRLLTVNPMGLTTGNGPLTDWGPWIAAFEQAGQRLLTLAQAGQLHRGLRAVLAHHIIFHANRAEISVSELSTLAALAMTDTFGFDAVVSAGPGSPPNTKVPQVTTVNDQQAEMPDRLRTAMTQRLVDDQVIHTSAVQAAFAAVPRHLFLPHVPAQAAYADEPVYTKTSGDGARISAASQPRIVAMMLEQLDLHPGHRVLEAGAGTGYNAALIGHMIGPAGHVTTVDVDADLVDAAREHLVVAGASNINVVLADGALGHPNRAPYDRIIATVGIYEIPTPLLDQLGPDGRLVVPLRLRGAASRSIVLTRTGDRWRSIDSQLAVFMPLRGDLDDARRIVSLTPEHDVTLQVNKDQTVVAAQLTGVLNTPGTTVWTGVIFPPMVPYEWIDLWLALRLPNSIMRMNTATEAIDRGQVSPMFPWGAMATVEGPNLAYLTLRPSEPVNGKKRYEIGVIGHGPDAGALADRIAAEAAIWDAGFRDRTVRFELPAEPTDASPDDGRFVIDRAHHPISVIWE